MKQKRFEGIKAVLFDIDDTLFPSSEFASLARKNAIRAMIDAGLEASEEEAHKELDKIIEKYDPNYGNHYGLLASKFKCKDKNHVIAAGIWAYHNTKASISPYPNAAKTLIRLREKGYLLAIASEGKSIKQWDKLIRLGLDSLFHRVFVTESGKGGKNSKFYFGIAKKLGIGAENIAMVGDNPKRDIMPAKAAGMKTIRVEQGKRIAEKDDADARISKIEEILEIL